MNCRLRSDLVLIDVNKKQIQAPKIQQQPSDICFFTVDNSHMTLKITSSITDDDNNQIQTDSSKNTSSVG